MTAAQGIAEFLTVHQRLGEMVAELRRECVAIGVQWDRLGAIGGQRDDHAASLLGTLKVHLRAIATTATDMLEDVEAIQADPFGD